MTFWSLGTTFSFVVSTRRVRKDMEKSQESCVNTHRSHITHKTQTA